MSNIAVRRAGVFKLTEGGDGGKYLALASFLIGDPPIVVDAKMVGSDKADAENKLEYIKKEMLREHSN